VAILSDTRCEPAWMPNVRIDEDNGGPVETVEATCLDSFKSQLNRNEPTPEQRPCSQCKQEYLVDEAVASRLRSMEPFVTTAAVAKFLGLSRRTVAKMAREGRIPAHPVSGTARRTWRFKLSEVEVSLASQLQHPILSERPDCSAESE